MSSVNPLVSVVVPNYNYADYLAPRIDSILRQTFSDFELLLLDDCSTDHSVSVMKKYASDPRVVAIDVNQTNTGSPFPQWMKGIKMARGKYVWIAEADDLAEPDFLSTLVAAAESHPDLSFCYAGSLLIDSAGEVSSRDINHWGRRAAKPHACFDGKLYAERNLYWKSYVVNASGALFRRDKALQLSDSPFLGMRYCGDWLFWFSMALLGDVVEVYQNLNFFRQHAAKVTNASRVSGGGVNEDITVVREMESKLPLLSTYKRRLRHGMLFKKIIRLHLPADVEHPILQRLETELGGTRADYRLMLFNRVLRWLNPFLVTPRRDRL